MSLTKFSKMIASIGLVGILLLVLVPSVGAFESRGGNTVIIGADEVVEDDLSVGAGTFILDGTVKGDLIAFGQRIEINGTVEGDLMAAGQTVIVRGTVQDDARLAGAVVLLAEGAKIADDVISAGYSLETRPGSQVGGDVVVASGQVLLAGHVGEDVKVAASGLDLRGQVQGSVEANVGSPEEALPVSPFAFIPGVQDAPAVRAGLTVREGARVGGSLRYESRAKVAVPAGSVQGQVRYVAPPVEPAERASAFQRAVNWFLRHLRRFIALLLVGLLLLWVAPRWIRRMGDALAGKPLPSLGWGAVTLFGFPVAFLIALGVVVLLVLILNFVTLKGLMGTVLWVGGLGLFALAVAFGLAIGYVAQITVSFLGGRLLLAQLNPAWGEGRVGPLLTGVLIFVAVTAIPFLGGLVSLFAVLFGLGAPWLVAREVLRQRWGEITNDTSG